MNLQILFNDLRAKFVPMFYMYLSFNPVDPEYIEFLEFLAKPVENLPSAEVQLERREAERSGS